MKIPPVKGTRDFYPEQMALRNCIVDGWKQASLRNGFVEYDGPIFEHLQMFQIKSGDEIAEQLFSLTDRGGRDLAIRPEITPTLARMVNQKINSLPRPIKWFSVPRLCRAERPQRGRLREFFQWNIDIIGIEDSRADAEVIFTTIDYLRSLGLTDKEIKVKISSRKLLAGFLKNIGIAEEKLQPLYTLLDKKIKLPVETFEELLSEQLSNTEVADKVKAFMELKSFSDIEKIVKPNDEMEEAKEELELLVKWLKAMEVWNYCCFEPGIIRGLAYYTGIIFEVHDIVGNLRAIGGGGRYDNLLKEFGGPPLSGTGMGMGDCVLEILLEEKGLIDERVRTKQLNYFIIPLNPFPKTEECCFELMAKLRTMGYAVNFSYRTSKLSKQLKLPDAQIAEKCIILGGEYEDDNQLVIKDMANRKQEPPVGKDEFFAKLKNKSK